ncbi:MAG TPA: hypothetical protein VK137_00020 [Planctomycetaceae bacterium]|nr:hypothetical protein [Planctomycetaceae bacterium]
MLRNRKILRLCLELPVRVLQTRDHSALLPECSHLSTCLLDADRAVLQAQLLWLEFLRLLQESWRCQLCRSLRRCQRLRQQRCSAVCGSVCSQGVRCSRSLRPELWCSQGLWQWLCSELCCSVCPKGLLRSGGGWSKLCRSVWQCLWQKWLCHHLRWQQREQLLQQQLL